MKKNTKIIIAVITLLMLVVTGAYSLLTGNDTATNGTVIVTREQLKKVVSISATLLSEDEPLLTKTYTTEDISAELTFEDGTTREAGLVSGVQGEVLTLENGKTAYRIDFINTNGASYIDTEYTINHTDTIEVGFAPDNSQAGVLFGAEDYSGGGVNMSSIWMPYDESWKPCYQYGSSGTIRSFQLTNGQEYVVRTKFGNNYNVELYKNEVLEENLIDTFSDTSSNRTLTSNTLYLGARHTPNNSRLKPYKGTISYMKITNENGKVVRNLIPVVDEDGKYAFYDKVLSKTYYSISGTPFTGSHSLEEAIDYSYIPELVVSREGSQLTVALNPIVYDYELSSTVELPKLVNINVEKLNNQKITPGAKFVPTDFNLTTVYDNGKQYSVPAVNPYKLTDGTEVTPIEYIYADKIAVPVGEINFDSKTYLELDLEMLEASDYARMMGFYGGSSNCCNLFNIEFASYTSANVFPGRYALNVGDYRNRNLYTVSYADQKVKTLDPHTRNLLYVVQTNYSWTTQNQMFYLKGGGDKTTYGTGKIYGFKYVYDNVTLMDLMPVKITDEQYGLYNKITQEMVFTMGANVNHGALKNSDMVNYDVTPYIISNDTTEIRFDLNSELYGDGVYTTYPIEVVTIESIAVEKTSTVPAYVGVEYDANDFEVKIVYSDGSEEIVDSNKYTISPSVIAEDTTEITITLLSEYFGNEMTTTVPVTPLPATNIYMIGNPVANKVVGVLTEDKKLTLYGEGDIKAYSSTTSADWYNQRESIEGVEVRGKLTPTNVKYLFSNLTSAVSITGLDNIDMTNTTDWSYMFYNDLKLVTLEGTEAWNPKSLNSTLWMFGICNNLPVIDLSSLDTSSLTAAGDMLRNSTGSYSTINSLTAAYAKTQADADKFNGMSTRYNNWVAKPEGSNFMIGRIDNQLIWQSSIKSSITEIEVVDSIPEDLSPYTVYDLSVSSKEPVKAWIDDTKMYIGTNGIITAPTSMNQFFRDYSSLTRIIGLENINTANTTDWSYMFYNDTKLVVVEGTETWNPKALISTTWMFGICNSLPVVDLSSLDTSSLTNVSDMLRNSTGSYSTINSLTAAYAKTQEDANKLNMNNSTRYNNWVAKPEGSNFMIGRIDGQLIWQSTIKSTITEIEVVNSIPEDLSSYTVYDLSVNSKEPVKAWIDNTKMYIGSNGTITAPTNMTSFFRDFTSLIKITGLDNIDMTNTTDWSYMFAKDSKLVNIEGTEMWNPKALTTTLQMFGYCNSLPTVNLSSLDTTALTVAGDMLDKDPNYYHGTLTSLTAAYARTQADADKFNGMSTRYNNWVAKPEGSNFMIGRIDGQLIWQSTIKSTITEIEVVNSIPEDLSSYTVYDLSVSSKEPIKAWINETKLYIGANGIITTPTSMASFFRDFTSLIKITGLDNFDMTNTTDWSYMFTKDSKLITIEGTGAWKPKALTTTLQMYGYCNSLLVVDLSSLDTSTLTVAGDMLDKDPNYYHGTLTSLTAAYARTQADADKFNGMSTRYNSWSTKTTTSFNLNGAVGTTPETIVSPPNKSLSLSTPEASKDGLVFMGWSPYSDNFSGKMTYTTSTNKPNATLYAIWMPGEVNYYNITLNMNYAGSADNSVQVPQGYKIWDNLPVPTRTGYDFLGWYDAPTNGALITTIWEPTEDTTIYAYWTPTVYTITYTLNSGNISEEARTTYTIEDEDFVLEIPTRSGYRFTGWNNTGYAHRTITVKKGTTGNLTYKANWQTAQAEGVLNDNVNFKAVLDVYKNSFTSVIFEESLPENIEEYTTIDFSYNYDNSVIGWIDDNQTLHIGSRLGKVVAYNTNGLFEGISYVERADISKLDISNITNTQAIFKNMENLKYVNMSGLDFSKVTESSWMFYNDKKLETIEWDHDFTATKNLENLFYNCNNLTASFYIAPTVTSYSNVLYGVSTASGQLTLKFEETNKTLTTKIYNTKSASSNVILEHVDNLYTITTDGSEHNYISIPNEMYENVSLELINEELNVIAIAYKLNGETINSSVFTMPSENANITDIILVPYTAIETEHNYSDNMDRILGSWNYSNATSVEMRLKYQLLSNDYFRIRNSDSSVYVKDDGNTTSDIYSFSTSNMTEKRFTNDVVSGEIYFYSNNAYTNWGLKAIIIPLGRTNSNTYSLTISDSNININWSDEYLSNMLPGLTVELSSNEEWIGIDSFDINGVTQNGNSFVMPEENAIISNVVLHDYSSEYTQVQYIESNGNQYINTGYIPTQNTKVNIKWLSTDNSGTQAIVGSEWNNNGMLLNIQSNAWYFHSNGQKAVTPSLTEPDIISYAATSKSFVVNGTTYNNALDNLGRTNSGMKVFGLDTGYYSCGKLYSLSFYEKGIETRKFIPVIHNSDNVAGLFEVYTKTFFASETDTALISGGFEHNINVTSPTVVNITPNKSSAYKDEIITLNADNVFYKIVSFNVNDVNMEGNKFVMPDEEAVITNIVVESYEDIYTSIEYVESDGNQYVNTGYVPNSKTKIEIKWLSTDTSGNQAIIGSVWNGNAMLLNIQSNIWYFHANGQRAAAPSLDEPDVISYSSAASSFVVNGTTYNNSADSLSNAKSSLKIFGLETAYRAKGKLYYVNILESNTLVKSYIPAVRNEDGVAGLFDTVNKEFLVSATETALLPPSQVLTETMSLFSEQPEEENVNSLDSETIENENVNNEVTNNEITNSETIENEVVDNNAFENEIVVNDEKSNSEEISIESNTEPVVGSTEITESDEASVVVENATAEENAETINEAENSSKTVENVETNSSEIANSENVEETTQEGM